MAEPRLAAQIKTIYPPPAAGTKLFQTPEQHREERRVAGVWRDEMLRRQWIFSTGVLIENGPGAPVDFTMLRDPLTVQGSVEVKCRDVLYETVWCKKSKVDALLYAMNVAFPGTWSVFIVRFPDDDIRWINAEHIDIEAGAPVIVKRQLDAEARGERPDLVYDLPVDKMRRL